MKFPLAALLAGAGLAVAQVPDAQSPAPVPAPAPAPAPAQPAPAGNQNPGGGGGDPSSFLGKDVPFIDPGGEIVSWDGKNWNISDNRLFKARFEKYLNAPPQTTEIDREYQAIISKIMERLAPGKVTPQSMDDAFNLLAKASQYADDAHLCDAIAFQVLSAWQARRANERMMAANVSLEKERKRLEWNAKMTAEGNLLQSGAPGSKKEGAMQEYQKSQQTKRDMELQPLLTRIAEIQALSKANQLKKEVAELQVKIEFQGLIVTHFLQRRYQHAVIGTRFYRSIFSDGDSQLRVGEDAKSLFSKSIGMPPTLGTLDSMANEIMRDVNEGIQSFKFLLDKGELESASNRLMETFLVGEYLPSVRTLDRDDKRKALAFVQKSRQLISAIQVKDYSLAEKLVEELNVTAKDIDTSKATAAIETARQVSAMHIAKARNAAVSGDKVTMENELTAAGQIWPRNPDLKTVAETIFLQGDVLARALVDLDMLISQKNYRQIYDDRMRFIAATAHEPEKQEQLRKVLSDMQVIETAIIQSQEIEKRNDFAGAWESAEKAFRVFPDDNKLNQIRANLTTKAADFVRAIRQAEDMEEKNQSGSSLAWYLKAQKEYPSSEFAKQGISRLTKEILPDAS
jgi:hypothetical protein